MQRTLDDYMTNLQGQEQQEQERNEQDMTNQHAQWGDHNPNEEGPGHRPCLTPSRRELMPLEYV
jgi:hypothetical protein